MHYIFHNFTECNTPVRFVKRNVQIWRKNSIELTFPETRKITGLKVTTNLPMRKWKFSLKHKIYGQWNTCAERGKVKVCG